MPDEAKNCGEHGCEFGRSCQKSQCLQHQYLRTEMDKMWAKINTFENRFYALVVLGVANLVALVGNLVLKALQP